MQIKSLVAALALFASGGQAVKAGYEQQAEYMVADDQQMQQQYQQQYQQQQYQQAGPSGYGAFAQQAAVAQPQYQEAQPANSFAQPAYQDSQPMNVAPPAQQVQAPQPQAQPPHGQASFLGVSSDAGYSNLLSTLTEAVRQQSQAMLALQTQEAQLEAHEVAFEAREASLMGELARRVGSPVCKGFKKNGAVEPTSQDTCEKACSTAEGFPIGDYKSVKDGGACKCVKGTGTKKEYITLCTDSSARTTASLATMLVMLVAFLRQ